MNSNTEDIEELENSSLELRFGKYRVRRLDTYNIVVEEMRTTQSGENAGSEYPVNIGYYKRLYNALEKILHFNLESKIIKGLPDVISALKEAETNLYKELETKYKNIL